MLNLKAFQDNLEKLNPDFESKKYLLAVSGGVDSMVVMDLFKTLKLQFEVAHINYALRGKDSDADEKIVEEFCKKNEIKFHLYQVSEMDQKPKNSIQIWARNLRYDFFRKIQKEENIEFLITAHHLNDQLETFLINLSKASGIKGLIGIPENENHILRPLLNFSKEEIYDFAKENNIAFREDLSNQKNDYLRNKIRNKIVPQLTEIFPDFLNQFGDSLSYLKSANYYLQTNVERSFQEILKSGDENQLVLNKEILLEKDPFIIIEIIRKFGFSGLEIEKIISAENGKFFRSKTHEIKITRTEIVCSKKMGN